jgi:hypothetical protein
MSRHARYTSLSASDDSIRSAASPAVRPIASRSGGPPGRVRVGLVVAAGEEERGDAGDHRHDDDEREQDLRRRRRALPAAEPAAGRAARQYARLVAAGAERDGDALRHRAARRQHPEEDRDRGAHHAGDGDARERRRRVAIGDPRHQRQSDEQREHGRRLSEGRETEPRRGELAGLARRGEHAGVAGVRSDARGVAAAPAEAAAAGVDGGVQRRCRDAERDEGEEGDRDRDEGVPLHVPEYAGRRE